MLTLKTKTRLLLGVSLVGIAMAGQGVSAQDLTDQDGFMLDTITVSSSRSGSTPLELESHTTVVNGETIDEQGISDMSELVRHIPGVTVERQTSAADPFNTFGGFTIRGVGGNRVQMQVDGSRVPERIIDGTRDYLDFNFVKQAEIVRGPASVLWGSDALAGVVALETIDPEDILLGRDIGGSAKLSYGSLNERAGGALTFARQMGANVQFMFALSRDEYSEANLSNARADGGIYGCPRNISWGATACNKLDPTNAQATRVLSKLVVTPTENQRFELSVDHLRRDIDVAYNNALGPVVSSLTGEPTGELTRRYDRELDLERTRYGLEHEYLMNGGILDSVTTRLSYTPNSYDSSASKISTSVAGDETVTNGSLGYSEDFLELDIQANANFSTGSAQHNMVFGFDGDRTTTDYERIDRVANLTSGINTETRGGGFNFANATTTRADFYAQDNITFGAFELTPGLRYATYSIDPRTNSDYQPVAGSEPEKREGGKLLSSLGATYHFNYTYSVWAHYGEGFKMPTAQQMFTSLPGAFFSLIPAPNLEPEEVKSYELGARAVFDRGYISANIFKSDYTNFIESFYNPPGTNDYTYRNIGTVYIWGVEASGQWAFSDVLSGNFAMSWMKGEQQANPDADTLDYTLPPLTTTVGVAYAIPQHDLSLEAVGTLAQKVKYTDSETDFKPGAYALLDLYASWRPVENGMFNFGLRNVFDRRYFEAGAASYATTATASVARANPIELQTGAGREFFASYEVKF